MLTPLLLPEETFQPNQVKARVLDVSPNGLGLLVPALAWDMSSKLSPVKRLARITLTHPDTGEQIRVTAAIAWHEYVTTSRDPRVAAGDCLMGLHLNSSVTGNIEEYEAFIQSGIAED